MRRALLIILLWLCAPAVWAQTAGTPAPFWQLIDDCIDNADPESLGIERLERECPGVRAALTKSGYAEFLSDPQLEELTPYSLVELRNLAQRYAVQGRRSLQRDTLDTILASLSEQGEATQPSLWERIERWLRELWGKQQTQDLTWLNEWLEKLSLSEIVMKTLLYVLVGLVIVIAIGVIVNELRVAGVLARRRSSGRTAGDSSSGVRDERPSLADLSRVPARERLSVLLKILVDALVTTGRLGAERGLTHRELSRNAHFTETRQRECFERIALTAERLVYGRDEAVLEEIEPLLRDGRRLHAELLEPRT